MHTWIKACVTQQTLLHQFMSIRDTFITCRRRNTY